MADRRERATELTEAMVATLNGWQAGLWTAIPAIIQSFDSVKMTVVAQPAIQARVLDTLGKWHWTTLPLLLDVPICFPCGGGFTLTFPIQAGDEALIIFSSRCFDSWWQTGGVQVQAELRMHDLSDGFAIAGPRSQPRVIPAVSVDGTELRSDDGQTVIKVGPGSSINLKANTIKIEAFDSLELKCNHGVVWTPAAIDTYQDGIPVNDHAPPAP